MAAVIKDIKLDFLEENNVVVLAKQEDAGKPFYKSYICRRRQTVPDSRRILCNAQCQKRTTDT